VVDKFKPIEFLGFEIMESKKYKLNAIQRQKSKIIIRPNTNKILERLLEKNVIMHRRGIVPYSVKDSKRHAKNIKRKKNGNNGVTT